MENFITSNPTYRFDKLSEVNLDPLQPYPIVQCRKCSMIYSLFHLDDEYEAFVYNHIIDAERSAAKKLTISKRIKDLKKWIYLLSIIEKTKPGEIDLKVLDYGCGFGTLLLVARGPGVQVVGFDVTDWKVEWARQQGLTIYTSSSDLKNHAPFDILISTDVLEHLHSPRAVLAEMTSLLKPGGIALITCIIQAVQENRWDEIRKLISLGRPIPKEINPWEHLNYFTIDSLSNILSEFGLFPITNSEHYYCPTTIFEKVKRKIKKIYPNRSYQSVPMFWMLRG